MLLVAAKEQSCIGLSNPFSILQLACADVIGSYYHEKGHTNSKKTPLNRIGHQWVTPGWGREGRVVTPGEFDIPTIWFPSYVTILLQGPE